MPLEVSCNKFLDGCVQHSTASETISLSFQPKVVLPDRIAQNRQVIQVILPSREGRQLVSIWTSLASKETHECRANTWCSGIRLTQGIMSWTQLLRFTSSVEPPFIMGCTLVTSRMQFADTMTGLFQRHIICHTNASCHRFGTLVFLKKKKKNLHVQGYFIACVWCLESLNYLSFSKTPHYAHGTNVSFSRACFHGTCRWPMIWEWADECQMFYFWLLQLWGSIIFEIICQLSSGLWWPHICGVQEHMISLPRGSNKPAHNLQAPKLGYKV